MRMVVASPLSMCSDCDRVGSSFTSHEQTLSRVARPNVVRKYVLTFPSAICTARAPSGRPGNLFFVSVACEITSSIVSARMRRTDWRAKFRVSDSFEAFGTVESWYVRDVQMSRTSFLKSYLYSVNFLPRASSSSAFDGGLLTRTSSTSWMMPRPKKWPQTMFARLVAKYGLSGDASQAASTCR